MGRLMNKLLIFCTFLLILPACGSDGGPFEMASSTTQVVGDAEATTVQFLSNPEEQTGNGTMTAQVDEVFFDRQTLFVEGFEINLDFDGVGPVRVVLNPNMTSTATVYKLNQNNQVFGTHTMNLNLIVETPDQNLTYNNVLLASKNATVILDQLLPILNFQFNGETKQLQTLAMSVTIPAQLIVSNEDPL